VPFVVQQQKDIIPRVARWWLQLQDYDFEIEYRPGTRMTHVDCLSRIPQHVMTITITEGLLATQMPDEEICKIRDILLTKDADPSNKTYLDNYIIKRNIVYKKLGIESKWLVPKSNRWQICRLCHDDQGHLGFDKTLTKIQENYWFPKMRRFVSK
jgi:hypothetical protein